MGEPKTPVGWKTVSLAQVADLVRGVSFPKEVKTSSDERGYVACLRTTNVQREVDWQNLWFIPSKYIRREEQYLRSGDVLISTANSLQLVGKVAQVKTIPRQATLGAFISAIRSVGQINPAFVYYQLTASEYQAKIRNCASTTTNISNVSTAKLLILDFSVPPAAEQERIVAKIEELLTKLDAGIQELRKAQAQLKRYRQTVLKAAVTGELTKEWREAHKDELEPASELLARILKERRAKWEANQLARMKDAGKMPDNDEWKKRYVEAREPLAKKLPSLPGEWLWVSVDQLTEIVTKGSSPNWQGFNYTHEGVIFVRSQNVGWGALDLKEAAYLPEAFNEKEKKSILKVHDVLLNIVGASIGRAAVATTAVRGGNVNQAVAIIRLLKSGFTPKLLTQYLISPETQRRINMEKVDVARANLSLDDIKSIPVPLMSLDEQEQIVAETERLLSIADASEQIIERNLKATERMRQSILKQAFEGKLVPQDPNDEPAEALLERIKVERAKRDAEKRAAAKPRRRRVARASKREE